jgi:hypothetical protein
MITLRRRVTGIAIRRRVMGIAIRRRAMGIVMRVCVILLREAGGDSGYFRLGLGGLTRFLPFVSSASFSG